MTRVLRLGMHQRWQRQEGVYGGHGLDTSFTYIGLRF
jgi:hypothetical protein